MAKRATSPDKILLDPLFPIPEGAEETFTRAKEQSDIDIETHDITSIADDFGEGYFDEGEIDPDLGNDTEPIVLDTPTDFAVIDQKIRRAPGGQMVVDIIIEVEDIDGATNYEVQVTKA